MPSIPIPVFDGPTNGADGSNGVVLSAGAANKIVCGTASDSGGGACRSFCPHVTLLNDTYDYARPERGGRDGCGGSWRPRDFGVFLRRSGAWQKVVQARGGRMDYNEIIVDGEHWNAHLPQTIEAFFGGALARKQRHEFMQTFGLSPEHAPPLLEFDPTDWNAPFKMAAVQ